jgi:hypothetical protein
MNSFFDPAARMLGGYLPYDGGVEFFGRVSAILRPSHIVVDLGAGRGLGTLKTIANIGGACVILSQEWLELLAWM